MRAPYVRFALLLLAGTVVGRLAGSGVLSVLLPGVMVFVALLVSVRRTVREDNRRNAGLSAAWPLERPGSPAESVYVAAEEDAS